MIDTQQRRRIAYLCICLHFKENVAFHTIRRVISSYTYIHIHDMNFRPIALSISRFDFPDHRADYTRRTTDDIVTIFEAK